MSSPIRFDIVDRQTGAVVGSCKTRAGASRSVDRRDNAYGAYRYTARPIYASVTPVTPNLGALLGAATRADCAFIETLQRHYPRADRWTWFRADEKVKAGTADSHERAMAENAEIVAAWRAAMTALHAYYGARDGDRGFLGSKGL